MFVYDVLCVCLLFMFMFCVRVCVLCAMYVCVCVCVCVCAVNPILSHSDRIGGDPLYIDDNSNDK